jgi:hypothetical protein
VYVDGELVHVDGAWYTVECKGLYAPQGGKISGDQETSPRTQKHKNNAKKTIFSIKLFNKFTNVFGTPTYTHKREREPERGTREREAMLTVMSKRLVTPEKEQQGGSEEATRQRLAQEARQQQQAPGSSPLFHIPRPS